MSKGQGKSRMNKSIDSAISLGARHAGLAQLSERLVPKHMGGVVAATHRLAVFEKMNEAGAFKSAIEGLTGTSRIADMLEKSGIAQSAVASRAVVEPLVKSIAEATDIPRTTSYDAVAGLSRTDSLMEELDKTGRQLRELVDAPKIYDEESSEPVSGGAAPTLAPQGGTSTAESVLDLGQAVRQARKDRRMNQQELADAAGVGRRFVSELERGKATLEVGKVLRVCHAAGVALFMNGQGAK